MLKTRALTIAVLLPLFVAAIFYLPTAIWALLLTLLALIGAWEWAALAGWRGASRVVYVVVIAAGIALSWLFAGSEAHGATRIAILILGISVIFWLLVVPPWLAKGWAVRASVLMGVAGIIVLVPTWLALVRLHAQPAVLLALMAIVWISDTAAYLCGRQWGRRKLAPAISPGKTWEGAAGAAVAVAVYYALLQVSGWAGHGVLHGLFGCVFFLLLVILGIEGDLFESWIKRTAGVKDSGAIFPGHGGVLDRVDALTATMPAAALLLSVAGGRL